MILSILTTKRKLYILGEQIMMSMNRRKYFPDSSILNRMMEDIWIDVGSKTYNNSLRDTVLGLKKEIEKRE